MGTIHLASFRNIGENVKVRESKWERELSWMTPEVFSPAYLRVNL
jgi:hypothetical protein